MSGITQGHNKFNSCADCPDRSVSPNCHVTCEGYLFRSRRREELKEKKKRDQEFFGFKKKVIETSKKRANMIK